MKTSPLYFIILYSLLCLPLIGFAQHTFSIVAVDPVTGEIGSAGATCLASEDGAQDISAIVLGTGAIHTQSFWNPINQQNATKRMEAGDSPQEIIDWLIQNDTDNDSSARQYIAVDLNNGESRSAAYSGADCFKEFIHITGPNYAIAGNILISEDVIKDMETAFLNTQGSLADKLMAAMQGAKRPGADIRCLNDGISSASAFLRVAAPDDTNSEYGALSLDLNVWITTTIFEPIDALQDAYDYQSNTLETADYTKEDANFVVFPNPSQNIVTIRSNKNALVTSYEITNVTGKVVDQRKVHSPKNSLYIDVMNYNKGFYFIHMYHNSVKIARKKILIN